MREELVKAREDLATEKLKCTAAVNKIQQVSLLEGNRLTFSSVSSVT